MSDEQAVTGAATGLDDDATTSPPAADRPANDNLNILLERLNDPQTVARLLDLLDNIDTLSGVLTIIDSFMERSQEILDNLTQTVKEMAGSVEIKPEIVETAKSVARASQQAVPLINKVGQSDVVERLTESKMTDQESLAVFMRLVDSVGSTMEDIRENPPQKRLTILTLPWQMRDRDFNRGLDFLLRLVNQIGQALSPEALSDIPTKAQMAERAQAELEAERLEAQHEHDEAVRGSVRTNGRSQ